MGVIARAGSSPALGTSKNNGLRKFSEMDPFSGIGLFSPNIHPPTFVALTANFPPGNYNKRFDNCFGPVVTAMTVAIKPRTTEVS